MQLRLTPRDVRVPSACILVRLKTRFQGVGGQISPPVTITTQYFSRSLACVHSIYVLYPYPTSLEKCIRYLSHDTVSELHESTSRPGGTPEVRFPACTAPRAHSRRNVQRRSYLYMDPSNPSDPSSFSSAPPPAIQISTPWEIIVRVSSASDLP